MALDYFDHDRFAVLTQDCKEHLTRVGEVVEYQKGILFLIMVFVQTFCQLSLRATFVLCEIQRASPIKSCCYIFLNPERPVLVLRFHSYQMQACLLL